MKKTFVAFWLEYAERLPEETNWARACVELALLQAVANYLGLPHIAALCRRWRGWPESDGGEPLWRDIREHVAALRKDLRSDTKLANKCERANVDKLRAEVKQWREACAKKTYEIAAKDDRIAELDLALEQLANKCERAVDAPEPQADVVDAQQLSARSVQVLNDVAAIVTGPSAEEPPTFAAQEPPGFPPVRPPSPVVFCGLCSPQCTVYGPHHQEHADLQGWAEEHGIELEDWPYQEDATRQDIDETRRRLVGAWRVNEAEKLSEEFDRLPPPDERTEPPTFADKVRARADRAGYEFYEFVRSDPAKHARARWHVAARGQVLMRQGHTGDLLEGLSDGAWVILTEERALRLASLWPDKQVDHVARARQVVESARSSWFSRGQTEAMRDLIRAVDALVCALEEKSVHYRERSR